MSDTEWAVQTRTFIDGPFDRTLTVENLRPHDEESARALADSLNRFRYGIARVVRREATPWHPEPHVSGESDVRKSEDL